MAPVRLIRLVVLSVILLFSLVLLGLNAHLTNLTRQYLNLYFTFSALAIATAVLSFVIIIPMLVIDFLRKGAVTSKIAVEIAALSFLWIMWLATAGSAVEPYRLLFPVGCGGFTDESLTICSEFVVTQALGFVGWLILLGYTIYLIVLSVIAQGRGNSVWMSTVGETDFDAPGPVSHVSHEHKGSEYQNPGYNAPQPTGQPQYATPQHTGTEYSQGYPQQQPVYQQNTGGYPPQSATPPIQGSQYAPGTPVQGYAQPGTPVQGYAGAPAQYQTPVHPQV